MSKLILLDTQIILWGIKGVASDGQEHKISRAKAFVNWLSENDYKLLLPVPQLAEIMSGVPPEEHAAVRAFFDKRFRIVPFDEMAAAKCAELTYRSFTDAEVIQYRKDNKVPRQKMKFDCMLVAIAITRGVSKIYSEDPDLKKFANGQIDVIPMPNILPQPQFDFGTSIPHIQPTVTAEEKPEN